MTDQKNPPRLPFGSRILSRFKRAIRARRRGICIGGYAGCGNLGDDAILLAYLDERRRQERPSPITVLSGNPTRDSRRFGVKCVSRRNPFAILAAFLRCEEFLCGGGSLLQNATGNLSLSYYLFLIRAAHALGCRPSLLAAGIGPIRGEKQWARLLSTLRLCRRVEVRDADSHRLLLNMGIDRYRLRLVSDPASALPAPPPERRSFLLAENGIREDEDYFCVILRPVDRALSLAPLTLAASVRAFAERRGLLPIYLLFDEKQDLRLTQHLRAKTGGKILRLREPADALAILSGARLTVAMRYHALVLSHAVGTPAIGISHSLDEGKLESFCRSVSFPHVRLPEESIVSLTLALEREKDLGGETPS